MLQEAESDGGPYVMLPSGEVERWMEAIGDEPDPDTGLYGIACAVTDYFGLIEPWGTPVGIFGDDPGPLYYEPLEVGGLFFRWIGADSEEQLREFAHSIAKGEGWQERTEWQASQTNYTVMDSCAFAGDDKSRIFLELQPGRYVVESQYAEQEASWRSFSG